MSKNEEFKAELKEKLKAFKRTNNLCGVEYVYNDPDLGRASHSIQTRGYYSWVDTAKEIFQTIETCEIISYAFLDPEP